jgi:hypothetical protein
MYLKSETLQLGAKHEETFLNSVFVRAMTHQKIEVLHYITRLLGISATDDRKRLS